MKYTSFIFVLLFSSPTFAQENYGKSYNIVGRSFNNNCEAFQKTIAASRRDAHLKAKRTCPAGYKVTNENYNVYPCGNGGHWGPGDVLDVMYFLSVQCE